MKLLVFIALGWIVVSLAFAILLMRAGRRITDRQIAYRRSLGPRGRDKEVLQQK